jgi:uncharacterized protein (DUF433 family)
MQLEEYFSFLAPDDIRIKGTRIGIESILYEYIHRGQSSEAIAEKFYTVSLDQVYATILYYLRNKESVEAYLADWLAFSRSAREVQERTPPPVVVKLRKRMADHVATTGN